MFKLCNDSASEMGPRWVLGAYKDMHDETQRKHYRGRGISLDRILLGQNS